MAKLVETNKEIVVNRSGIVEDSTDYGLDVEDAFVIEVWTERRFGGVLDLGAIYDGSVLVRGKLAFIGVRMITFEAEIGDVVIYGEAAGALSVIPLEAAPVSRISLAFFGDVIVFLEGIA